ncbi:hypothetical protein Zm00014a_013157 [Zea mays]|uniref:Uncharacterized protein n=1 Tax=Zea mays TaxID=4577 RepID=A0A3L6FQY6_MAIZE|nr:hypothetical protein Zm00014a_013157 [Zea mays]
MALTLSLSSWKHCSFREDVNETREEEARGEDAADYDAVDADYEQEDDAGGGAGDGWSSGGGQFESGGSADGWDSWPSDAGASTNSTRATSRFFSDDYATSSTYPAVCTDSTI